MDKKEEMFKHKILVVDDQIGIVAFLYDFFTVKNYNVLQATSGRKAVQLVKKEAPDVVLLDVKLGWGRNGIETLQEIKELAPDVKVIMMTSVDDDETIAKAHSLGADDYIIKPFSLSYLEKVVLLKILNLQIKRLGDG